MRRLVPVVMILMLVSILVSCNQPAPPQDTGEGQPEQEIEAAIPDQYQAARAIAKRAVLYKLARQEGDLAPFTAVPESIEGREFPNIALQLNTMWWSIELETARLASLDLTEITGLEADVFPLIACEVIEEDVEAGWVLFALGYDPDVICVLIANAHEEWLPEVREIFLSGMLGNCLQIWCGKVSGEWKLLAHLPCTEEVEGPEPPQPPTDMLVGAGEEMESEEPGEIVEETAAGGN